MNTYIHVKNFGPIEKAEIDLRPLTVFVGESNTGKTYLAALLYALHRHFEGFSRFTGARSAAFPLRYFYHSRPQSQNRKEEIEREISEVLEKLSTPGRPFKFSDLPQQQSTLVESILTDNVDFPNELKRCFDLEAVSQLIRYSENRSHEMIVALSVCEGDQKYWDFQVQEVGSADPTITGYINPDMILLDSPPETKYNEISTQHLLRSLDFNRRRTEQAYYLPAARSGIMQSHGVIASALIKRATRIGLDHFEVSTFSGMIADFLEQIVNYKKRQEPSEKINRVAEQLEAEVLDGKIEVKRPTSDAYPEFLYRPEHAEEPLRMSHSAAMVSELAPLVLFLREVVEQGDLLIIEEPESHLHPGAQTKIAHTLARLVRAGVRVLITTHSNWLLQQIGNLIREGELRNRGEHTSESADWLEKSEVGAWRFHKNKPVTEIPFDLSEGIEPEDHLDIAEALYNYAAGLENKIEATQGGDAVESE